VALEGGRRGARCRRWEEKEEKRISESEMSHPRGEKRKESRKKKGGVGKPNWDEGNSVEGEEKGCTSWVFADVTGEKKKKI